MINHIMIDNTLSTVTSHAMRGGASGRPMFWDQLPSLVQDQQCPSTILMRPTAEFGLRLSKTQDKVHPSLKADTKISMPN